MYIVDKNTNRIKKLNEVMFSDYGIKERDHLQEWIANEPDCLGEELLIIQKEFDGFDDTKERLDLLALDKDGNLVIIENKLDDSGRDVVWQALKYTSYCSTLRTEQIIDIYQKYLDIEGKKEDSKASIMEFLQIEDSNELFLNRGDQRIIFIANKYRKEVTSTVFWLLDHDIQIQCFSVTPSLMGEQLILNINQIIPPPDTNELMVSIKERKKEDQKSSVVKDSEKRLYKFWSEFKQKFEDAGFDHLSKVTPKARYTLGFAKGSAIFAFAIGSRAYRVEMYFRDDEDKALFDSVYEYKSSIESQLDIPVIWERLDGKKGSRIKVEFIDNDWDSFKSEKWTNQFEWYISAFDKFYSAISPIWEDIQARK